MKTNSFNELNLNIRALLIHLPAIYHESALITESPLGAILTLIHDNFKSVEEIIQSIDTYFDPYLAPDGGSTASSSGSSDFLSWLGSWISADIDRRWPSDQKRFALRMATKMNRMRGTARGLLYKLGFTYGVQVDIIEWTWPQGMQIGVRNTIGVDTRLHERPELNHCFVIKWQPPSNLTGDALLTKIRLIRDLIDRERPAHTRCFFWVARPIRQNSVKGGS